MRQHLWRAGVVQALVILAVLWLVLDGPSGRVRAPLRFTGNSLVSLGDVKAGWDANDARSYLHAYYQNFTAPTMLTYLRIPGTFEYWDILDKNLSTVMSGGKSAKQGIDNTAAAWERVTDQRWLSPPLHPNCSM